jgi:CarD family transcriptional regulator
MATTTKKTVKSSGTRTALVKKAAQSAAKTTAVKKAPAAPAPLAKAPAPLAKATNVVKLAAPAAPVAKMMPAKVAPKAAANTQESKIEFVAGDYVVYPVHGVGRIDRVETIAIAGFSVTTYVITFEKERMTLKVPVSKAKTAGLRKLSSKDRIKNALETLSGKAQIRRVMWSRRAQEYEAKINSGDPVSIAEVVRDLHRASDQPEQSYSERQIYQAALERLARELAAIEKIDTDKATAKLEGVLAKAA